MNHCDVVLPLNQVLLLFRFDHWCVMLDLGGGWCSGVWVWREERADEKERRKREKRREIMRERREKFQGIKKVLSVHTISYSTILHIRRYCSSIVKKFTISSPDEVWFLCENGKICQHMAYGNASANALRKCCRN